MDVTRKHIDTTHNHSYMRPERGSDMGKPLRLLVIEDSEDDALLLIRALREGGFEPAFERIETGSAMKKALQNGVWDVVISDYVMPAFSGLEALSILKDSALDIPFLIVSGQIGEDIAVEAMRLGAHDYILKGHLARLVPAIKRELNDAAMRRTKSQLEEERIHLAAAVDAATDAIVITDIRGIVQYVNRAFEEITGYAREEIENRDDHFLCSGKHYEAIPESMMETLRLNGEWSGRLIGKKKNGTRYYEDCTYSPVRKSSGEIRGYVSIKRDVTDKLKLESIAETVDMMNNIGYIFTGVRHEIGNLLLGMSANLIQLTRKLDKLDKPAIKQYAISSLDALEKVEFIFRSLRNLNMFENIECQDVRISEFMDDFLALVREDFTKKGIMITVLIEPGTECCHTDPRALQQIVLNILTNAADALTGRNKPRVSLTVSGAADMILIRIEDNGCGITKEKINDLFKPFHTTKAHGTGLGLVIVKKMLDRMQGTIEIESRMNEGTRVDLRIPAGKYAAAAQVQ